MKVILEEISKGRQNVFVQKIIQGTNNLIRLDLNSDSYDFQCYSKIYIFDKTTNKWNVLYNNCNHLIPSKLAYSISTNQSPEILLPQFSNEIRHLRKIASQLLNDKF
ncbi:MAG: hypothetical protein KBE91_08420 [Bacteroidia bacterium]|nr:hypothetical protein [Bacteroidia bacterium]